jgi:hypothetical protein
MSWNSASHEQRRDIFCDDRPDCAFDLLAWLVRPHGIEDRVPLCKAAGHAVGSLHSGPSLRELALYPHDVQHKMKLGRSYRRAKWEAAALILCVVLWAIILLREF